MATYTDNFNRASLGTDWTARWGTPAIISSTLFGGTAAEDDGAEYSVGTFANDQYCQADVQSGASEAYVVVRANHSGVVNGYFFGGVCDTFNVGTLFKLTGSTPDFTSLGTTPTNLPTSPTLKITIEGLAIKCYVNGVEKLSVTDSGTTISSGKAMIDVFRAGSAPTITMDNFDGGDMGAPPAAVQSRLMMMGVGP